MPPPSAPHTPHAAHLTWVLQAGGWALRHASDEVQALLGFAPADFLAGRVTLPARIHPDDQDMADALFALGPVPTDGTAHLRVRHAQGRIVCVHCTHTTTHAPGGEPTLHLTLQDAKRLPRTLDDASTTANFRAMMENTDDFIYFKDRHHVFTGASQTLVKVCEPAEHWTDLLGQTDYDVFPEAYADIYYRLEKQVFQGQPLAQETQKIRTRDGKPGWVDNRKYPIHNAQGELIGLFGVARDITKRVAAEDQLRAHEAQQRQLLQNLKVGVVVHAPDTSVVMANAEAIRLLGLSLDQMVGKAAIDPAWCFVDAAGKPMPPSDYPAAQVFATQQPLVDFTGGIQQPGTTGVVWVLVNAYCELDEQHALQRVVVTFLDITLRKQAEAKLTLAAQVFTSAHEGILITDTHGAIVDVNETFTHITGYSRDEVLGHNPRILQSGRHHAAFYDQMWRDIATLGHWSGEVWNRRKNGEVYPERLTISAVYKEPDGGDGAVLQPVPQHYVALFSDITAIKAHQSELERMAHFDTLTGLPNRLLLSDRLERALRHSQRRAQSVAVVYLDLDNIKAINDRHGHDAGDAVLVAVAGYMQQALREGDTLARIGGDEFVAVLVDLDDAPDCIPVVQRLLQAAATPVALHAHTGAVAHSVHVSASVGVTFYPQDNVEADVLLRHADQAMYLAKLGGKNRFHLFDVAQDAAIHSRHEDLKRLGQALKQGEFVLYYQPKVNMRTGQVAGAEALVRWQHPTMGLLPPAAFLPTMEEHAVSVELGEWVIATALAQMAHWRRQGLDLEVSVNIGALQLQQANFPQRLAGFLAAQPGVPPERLQLEILETSALADTAQVTAVMEACRALHVAFALDDFGTGYSSLSYLRNLRADVLKIDQSFVFGMTTSPDDLAIVKGIIGLADVFHREVIAEGVETHAHGMLLMGIGCNLAQGYGIARPMPASDMPAWVQQWQAKPVWAVESEH